MYKKIKGKVIRDPKTQFLKDLGQTRQKLMVIVYYLKAH